MRAAARRAGVSHSAPYRHFPDREGLLAALAAQGFRTLDGALQEARAAGGLRAQGEAYVRFALANPQCFRLMFGGGLRAQRDGALAESATRVVEGLSQSFTSQLPGCAGYDASIAAWSLVHGLAVLLLDDKIADVARRGRVPEVFVRAVLSSIRFAASVPQSSA